jgi:hypothetical protein
MVLQIRARTGLVLGMGAAVIGMGVALGAVTQGNAATTASRPAVMRAEDLGYRAQMGPIRNLDDKGPELVQFNVYLSGKDLAAWGFTTGEQEIFVDTDAKLLKAQTEDGALHTLPSGPWVEPSPPMLKFYSLNLGGAQHRLTTLEFEVSVVKVTEWRKITARKEAADAEVRNGNPVDCGAFQFSIGGTSEIFRVQAGGLGGSDEARRAYAATVPLGFLTHEYALSTVEVKDGNGLILPGGLMMMENGGAHLRHFAEPEVVRVMGADGQINLAAGPAKKVVYPVTATMRLPAKWEKQRVVYRLGEKDIWNRDSAGAATARNAPGPTK